MESNKLGSGSRLVYDQVREVAEFQDKDRSMEQELAAVADRIKGEGPAGLGL